VANKDLDYLKKLLFILHEVLDDKNTKEFDFHPLHHRCTQPTYTPRKEEDTP
jgi:hypothetical protein